MPTTASFALGHPQLRVCSRDMRHDFLAPVDAARQRVMRADWAAHPRLRLPLASILVAHPVQSLPARSVVAVAGSIAR